jgi:hypothetical protein
MTAEDSEREEAKKRAAAKAKEAAAAEEKLKAAAAEKQRLAAAAAPSPTVMPSVPIDEDDTVVSCVGFELDDESQSACRRHRPLHRRPLESLRGRS